MCCFIDIALRLEHNLSVYVYFRIILLQFCHGDSLFAIACDQILCCELI